MQHVRNVVNFLVAYVSSYNKFLGVFLCTFTHADVGHLNSKQFSSPLLKSSGLPVCVAFAHLIMFLSSPGHDQFTDVFSINHPC